MDMKEKENLEIAEDFDVEERQQIIFEKGIHELFIGFEKQKDLLSEHAYSQLKELLLKAPSSIHSNTYIEVMYMLGKYYDLKENRNGARYCAMRMLQMKEQQEKTHKKGMRNIEAVAFEFSLSMNGFLHKYTDFLEQVYHSIRMKLLIVSGLLLFVAFMILRIFAKVNPIIAFLEAFLLSGLNYYIQGRKMPSMFQKNQLRAIEQYVDSELQDFDARYVKL